MFWSRIAGPACGAVVCAVLLSGCQPATLAAPSAATTPTAVVSSSAASASSATASPTGGIYGDPAAAAKYWQQQSLEDNCGLVSVADVVGEVTGNEPTEKQMIALAVKTPSGTNPGPIYANDGAGGIEMADEVVLLQHFGIKSAMYWTTTPDQTGLPALKRYLGDDRKIIAWVNSAVIWNTSDQRTEADHFLVVTGIDTDKEIVHLNDPGAEHADERVSISTFMTAWKTGKESIVVAAAAG